MRVWIAIVLLLPLAAWAQTQGFEENSGKRDGGGDAPVQLPPYPRLENYLPFQVNAVSPFAFSVDAKSISVGADRVVRYSLIAKSSNGGLNVSFEGMRCADAQIRIYALGRSDGTWSELRKSRWERIRIDQRNAERAVLYNDFFCSVGGNIATAEDGVRVLKSGGNPKASISGY